MMHVRVWGMLLIGAWSQGVVAQENTADLQHEELDVTLQIIADPDAKLPDEVVRRIPLPTRKQDSQSAPNAAADTQTSPEAAKQGKERAREAQELGSDMSERAKERAQDAAEQREQARRSQADERRRNPDPPSEPPRPPRPPRP